MSELQYAIAQAAIHEGAQGEGRRAVIPASVGGWNALDSEVNMRPEYAIEMTNILPERGSVISRREATEFADTLDSEPTLALFNWQSGGDNKLFAFAGTSIYDVTDPEAIVLQVGEVTSTHSRWRGREHERSGHLPEWRG